MLKGAILQCINTLGLSRPVLRATLKAHNLSYKLSGRLSQFVEKDGLHPKHRIMDYHHWFVNNVHPAWSVLDLGCNNGALTLELSAKCKKVTGVELSEKLIEEAKKRVTRENTKFICADATTYPFEEKFDAITLSNVLEHIEDRVEFLKKLKRLSSRFLIRVPLIDRDWITLYKKELGVDYRLDPTHFTEYTFDQFKNETSEAGLEIEDFRIRYGELYAVLISEPSEKLEN